MDIEVSQEIYYSNRTHLPLAEVAASLLSLEKSSRIAPVALEKIFDGVVVERMSVYLDELHSGSLKEKVRYYLQYAVQKRIEEESKLELGELDKVAKERQQKILGWLIAACILVALDKASSQIFANSERPNLENQINITFQIGSELTGIAPDVLRGNIEEAVKESPEAVKGAVGFVRPAKRDPEAEITVDSEPYFGPKVLAEVPTTVPDPEPQEKVVELQQTEVHIRATDRDSGRKGWGATIPDFSEKRLRLSIAPGIDLNYLAHHDVVIGAVAVFYTVDAMGNIIRPHAHLYSVDKERTKFLPNGGKSL